MLKSLAVVTVIFSLSLFATGCASSPEGTPEILSDSGVSSNYAAPAEPAVSLFKEDQAVISDADFAKALAAKVSIPSNARLAVVRVGQLPYWWGWSEEFARTNKQIDSDFLGKLATSKHVKQVCYMPTLITPQNMTLPYLRQAAGRMQADLLLVYRTTTANYQRQKIFTKDESKAYCTVEAILLDTRTGLIPFSTLVSEDFTLKRSSDDADFAETASKARQQAIGKAWLTLANQTVAFLDAPSETESK